MSNHRHSTTLLCRLALALAAGSMMQPAAAQTLLEYFWNSDPGIGRGKKAFQDGYEGEVRQFTLDASGLTPGINILGMRAFEGRRWSHTNYSFVVYDRASEGEWRGEYFWDNDPGYGKATPQTLRPSADGGYIQFDVPTDQLGPGAHLFGVRTATGAGWSATHTYMVTVPFVGEVSWQVEYFWDTDPGYGKGIPVDASQIAGTGMLDVTLLTDGLSPGNHTLGVRTCSSVGWSATITAQVLIPGEEGAVCTAAEYFWGDDPGYGKGTPIEVTPGDSISIDQLEIDFPTEVAENYVLSFRARTDLGWGPTITKVIEHLYVKEITIEADTAVMAVGAVQQLRATIDPAESFDDGLTWSSSNAAIASVDAAGKVKALKPGVVTITATATDGTGVTASKEIEVIIPVSSVKLSHSHVDMSVSDLLALRATVGPADATHPDVAWSIEGEAVKWNSDGLLEAVKRGSATVTATTTDGTALSDSCTITVGYLMGDANDDGRLAVNDVVLTARGVVDDIDSKLVIPAVDINADNLLTVGDLTQVATLVIDWTPAHISALRPLAMPRYAGSAHLEPEGPGLGLVLEGMADGLTGLQLDLFLPEGMELAGLQLADGVSDGHTSMVKQLPDGRYRLLAYSTRPMALKPGNPVVTIIPASGSTAISAGAIIEVSDIMASDHGGELFDFGSASVVAGTLGLDGVSAQGLIITVERRTVIVTSPTDTQVTVTDMKGVSRRVALSEGVNKLEMPAPGVYAIGGTKVVIR